MKDIVSIDLKTGVLSISLPPEEQDKTQTLADHLQKEFAYESMDSRTIERMNQEAKRWLEEGQR